MVLVGFKLLESVADALYGVMQIHGRLYVSGISLALKSISSLLVFWIVDVMTDNMITASIGIIIVNLLVIIFFDMHWAYRVDQKVFRKDTIKKAGARHGSWYNGCRRFSLLHSCRYWHLIFHDILSICTTQSKTDSLV